MTICSRPVRGCPDCGDALIHQFDRGPHESSSAFGQYIHDRGEVDRVWREMFWMDIDGAIYKKRTTVLRIIEHKPHLGALSAGQREVLPHLAKALQLLAATGLVHSQSGVFVLYSDHPHDSALVHQVAGWQRTQVMPPTALAGELLDKFLQGEVIELEPGGG